MDSRAGGFALETPDGLRCVTWSLRADPRKIPNIPQLPELESPGMSQEERTKTTTLVKIAAFDSHLIGLTNKGHVLKFGALSNEDNFEWTTRWQFVSHPAYASCLS
jgi:SCF-associated factor 1